MNDCPVGIGLLVYNSAFVMLIDTQRSEAGSSREGNIAGRESPSRTSQIRGTCARP